MRLKGALGRNKPESERDVGSKKLSGTIRIAFVLMRHPWGTPRGLKIIAASSLRRFRRRQGARILQTAAGVGRVGRCCPGAWQAPPQRRHPKQW